MTSIDIAMLVGVAPPDSPSEQEAEAVASGAVSCAKVGRVAGPRLQRSTFFKSLRTIRAHFSTMHWISQHERSPAPNKHDCLL
jgi:hypothetical protein